ncbi:MAG: hypothetical protein ACYCYP_02560 [Leptospirales bacterium]
MAKRKSPRFFLSRVLYAIAGVVLAGSLFLLILMLSAETEALDRAHHLNLAAISHLDSLMNAKRPEEVPTQIREISSNMGGRTTLLNPGRKPSYRTTRLLSKMQSLSRVSDAWLKAPHGPYLFPWPPDNVPARLAEEASRLSGLKKEGHLLTNREGTPTPIQPVGGFAAWSTPVPNAPACAQCHGFDSEVLGYMVTFVPVPSILPDHRGVSLWGFWPFPGLNQKIIFFLALSGLGILMTGLIVLEARGTRKDFRRISEKNAKSSQDAAKIRAQSETSTEESGPSQQDSRMAMMDPSDKATLESRLATLDREIEKEIELLPHAGIQAPLDLEKEERRREAIDRFSSWSDEAELLLMELKSFISDKTDPVLGKSVQTLEKLKNEALDLNLHLEDSFTPQRRAPAYDALSEIEKSWVEELRTSLRHLHAEVRAIVGMIHDIPDIPPPENKS